MDDDVIEFIIPLAPVVASRPRAVRGRCAFYLPKYQAYRDQSADALSIVVRDLPKMGDSPLAVDMEFVCPRPKRPANPFPVGDIDNFAKAALDAVTKAGLWDDDDQVVEASARKRYAKAGEQPHTRVRVRPLEL